MRTRVGALSVAALVLATTFFSQSYLTAMAGISGEASRYQYYTSGVSDVPDLNTVWADWPFTVLGETCDGDHSDYCVHVIGPRLDEGGYHATITASLSLCVRRANYGGGHGTTNHVYSHCRWCPNDIGKTGFHGTFNGLSSAIIHHDDLNDRWGMYVDDKFVRLIDDSDARMDGGDFLWVGGIVSDERSILGNFAHNTVGVQLTSTGYEEFQPFNDQGILEHKPPPGRYYSQYSRDGSVGVFTIGEADCPE